MKEAAKPYMIEQKHKLIPQKSKIKDIFHFLPVYLRLASMRWYL